MPSDTAPTPPDSPAPAAGRGLIVLARGLARLPLGLSRTLGALAGLAAWVASSSYRAKARDNLARAGYLGLGLALRAAMQAGSMSAELPFIWWRSAAELARRVRCDQLDVLEAAEREGRGIVFLTPHLGGFEVTARWYGGRAPITVLFRTPHQVSLGALLAAARAGGGVQPVPASFSGVRAMLRALRAGEAVGLLPDQVPGAGEGRWASFFGEPAYTMTLPLKLAQASGAAVVIAVGTRERGGWRLRLERFEDEPTPERINARMETLIRAVPEQYLWGYNRYKRPHGAAPADRL